MPSARLSADVEGRSRVEDNRVGTVSLKLTSSMYSRVARATRPTDPARRGIGTYAARAVGVLVLLVSVLVAGLVIRSSPLDGPTTASIAPPTLGSVESLYAQDLVARINAERAARNSTTISVPQLQVDPNLSAMAQSWSGQIAANGVVQDPSLPSCSGPGGSAPSSGQVCIFAANSGSTGSGYWPGDGSDGMNGDYMASAGHRQNMLNAGLHRRRCRSDLQRQPGVDGRAVRLLLRRPRSCRRAVRPCRTPTRATRCRPVRSWPAPRPVTRSTARDRRSGRTARSPRPAGSTPTPTRCRRSPASRARRPRRRRWAWPRHRTATGTGWPRRTARSPTTATQSTSVRWPAQSLAAPITHIVATSDGKGLLAGRSRRRHLRLR